MPITKKTNIDSYLDEQCDDLYDKQIEQLKATINKYKILFNGSLGKWKRDTVSFS